jgi:sulfonate transport system substrate-binding protein
MPRTSRHEQHAHKTPSEEFAEGVSMIRRKWIKAGVGGAIGLLAIACATPLLAQPAGKSGAAADVVTLRVGTNNNYGFTPTFPAHGDDAPPGFKFEIVSFPGGTPQLIAALNAGELDIAEMGEVGPVIAQAGDTPFKIIAATQPWGKGQAIIVSADGPIKTAADLKGKRIAYVRGSNAHWIVIKALESANLTIDAVQSITLPAGMNPQSVLDSGQIDATTAIANQIPQFEANGSRKLLDGSQVGAENPLYYVASDDAIRTKKNAVAAYVRQLARHIAWGRAHPDEKAKAVATILKIEPSIALRAQLDRPTELRAIDETLVANNQRISDLFHQQGVIKQKLDAARSFTTEFNGDITP